MKELVNNWFIKADNDLKTAEFGMTAEEPITDTICFHCQQAVEKYLKAFIVYKGQIPGKTHNIAVLLRKCAQLDNSFLELSGIDHLTDYAVTLRYADGFYIPPVEEAEAALEDAQRVKEFVISKIK
ncbi:MAG: HEPN domain-containing protein [Firmicutes bacterium]|nr:HEPN domain-containing protein [Bacillota bacterium]